LAMMGRMEVCPMCRNRVRLLLVVLPPIGTDKHCAST
jgi:hypothetical protein